MKSLTRMKVAGAMLLLAGASGIMSQSVQAANVSCKDGMIVDGIPYKATSLTGIQVSNIVSTWVATDVYNVSMSIMADQGLKKWFSSADRSNWQPYPSRSDKMLQARMSDCSSGMVVAAQRTNTVYIGQGTATVTITAGVMGGYKGDSYVLYDEKLDGFIKMSDIGVEAPYAYGYSKEDANISRKIDFRAAFTNIKNVPDGVHTVNVMVPVGATTTWMPDGNGYNYWWATSGRSVPLSYAIVFPITVRVSNNTVVDPKASCSAKSPVNLNHGALTPARVNNNTATATLAVTCTAATSGSVQLWGDNDSAAGYTSLDVGKGITSQVSVSSNGSNWARRLTSVPLNSGTTNLQVRSVLVAPGTVQEGNFSSSAVLRVSYN